jgi:L-threonylcarbamoyladenylate synthase
LALGQLPSGVQGVALPAAPGDYAYGLYAMLRELDTRGASEICVELPPQSADWLAVNDRLARAASRR